MSTAWAMGALVAVASLGVFGCSSESDGPGGQTGGAGGVGAGSGGLPASGGVPASGGTVSTGGAPGAGGGPSTGGTSQGSGGFTASGGEPPSGGVSSGGAASGGVTASGGAASGATTSSGGSSSGGTVNTGGQNTGGSSSAGDARAIANPPSYMGSKSGGSGCSTSSPTLGFEPTAGGKHPLFLYFVGTTFSDSDTSARYDSQAAKAVTEAMARRGFVALSAHYDNTLNLSLDKLTCAFTTSNAKSLLGTACALSNVDCGKGIATWGHSQGALMAHAASQFEPRVRAVWATGYSGGSYPLPSNRLRVVNGENDQMNGTWDTAKKAAGYSTGECPNNGGSECFRSDGSGFAIVRKADCVTSTADHCWFDRRSCGDNAISLEPNWTNAASTKTFALGANADWVAATVARP